MPFNQFKLDIATEQSRGIFNQYVYETTDTLAETQVAGYFAQSRFINDPDWIGSLVTVKATDGGLLGEFTDDGTMVPSDVAADYEEGTWIPTDNSGAALTFVNPAGSYVRVGRLVTCTGRLQYPSTANGSSASIGGLPFTASNIDGEASGSIAYSSSIFGETILVTKNTATAAIFTNAGAATTNAQVSIATMLFTLTYMI